MTKMNGLTEEQQKRSSLLRGLSPIQRDLILSGVLGILESWKKYDLQQFSKDECSEELLNEIDTLIEKANEKGMYL